MNHPKHFWMFKNIILKFDEQNIKYKVFVSSKDVLHNLLENYGISYTLLGSNKPKIYVKLVQFVWYSIKMLYFILIYNPKILIGQALPHFAISSFFAKEAKFLILEDTEHVSTLHKYTVPFCDVIYTPLMFPDKFGNKQRKINSFFELLYLHPDNFKPDIQKLEKYGITKLTNYIVIRLVSWEAHHDKGSRGISDQFLSKIISYLEEHNIQVYISAEGKINNVFKKYKIDINPVEIHDLLYYSKMYLGEGATMAAEASLLGTNSIYVNPLNTSFCKELSKSFGLMYNFRSVAGVFPTIKKIINDPISKNEKSFKLKQLLDRKVNPLPYFYKEITDFL